MWENWFYGSSMDEKKIGWVYYTTKKLTINYQIGSKWEKNLYTPFPLKCFGHMYGRTQTNEILGHKIK